MLTPTRRFAAAALGAAWLLMAVAGPVAAKEGFEAQLDTPVSLDAQPGSSIVIGWRVGRVEDGTVTPLIGSPVFVRLVPPEGPGGAVTAFGTERPSGSGHYVATVVVPAGGIAAIEVGLRGQSCTNGSSCTTSDLLFPLTDDALVTRGGTGAAPSVAAARPTEAPVAGVTPAGDTVPASATGLDPGPAILLAVLAAGALLTVVLRVAARRATAPGSHG